MSTLLLIAFVLSVGSVVLALLPFLKDERADQSGGTPPPKAPILRTRGQRPLLVAAAILLAVAVIAAMLTDPPPARTRDQTAIEEVATSCTFYGFPEGLHEVPEHNLRQLEQTQDDCLEDLLSRLQTSKLTRAFAIGRSDQRELRAATRQRYGSNLSLAQQRAEAVLAALGGSPRLASNDIGAVAVALIAGARHVGPTVSEQDLALDRSVEIRTVWSETKPVTTESSDDVGFGFRLNAQRLDVSESLALLAFMVALSAYLATIRTYLGTVAVTGDRKLKVQRQRALITLADLPMIAATFFLGVHIFLFASARFLRASIVLFLFGGTMMLLMHSLEWWRSFIALSRGPAAGGQAPPPVQSPAAATSGVASPPVEQQN